MDINVINNTETIEPLANQCDRSPSVSRSEDINSTNITVKSDDKNDTTTTSTADTTMNNNKADLTTLIDWQRKCIIQNKEIERLNKLNQFLELERKSRQ